MNLLSLSMIRSIYCLAGLLLSSCTSTDTSHSVALSQSPFSVSQALSQKLNQHELYATQGLEKLEQGLTDEATKLFNDALRLNPRNADYHLLNALAYHLQANSGDGAAIELAKQGYELALKFDNTSWLTYFLLGHLYLELDDFGSAKQSLAQALLLNKDAEQVIKALGYAAYRSTDVELAANMVDRLHDLGLINDVQDYKNAAMVHAAIGNETRAEYYYQLFTGKKHVQWQAPHIKRRLDDWKNIHKTVMAQQNKEAKFQLIQQTPNNNSNDNDSTYVNSNEATASINPPIDPQKMVVVDVVIIRTEEALGTSKGINLLNGLKIQFGSQDSDAWGSSKNNQRTTSHQSYDGDQSSETLQHDVTDIITRAVSIPALSYSFNIFNTTNQRNDILARPSIVAMNGQRSEFFSGVELNAAAVSGGNGAQPVNLKKDIGVKLNVTPEMLDDGRIKMEVYAERTFLKTPSSDVNFTFRVETSKTTVNANIVMRYGETLILSGLSEKESENTRDGVPFLQDIPGLQYLFSNQVKKEFQKSVLILLTPRPAQYVYQPENARKEYEASLSADERSITNLRARYSDWFKPYPNWASVFKHMQHNNLYREFRTGDVELEKWSSNQTLWNRLKESLDFLWY